MNNDFGIQEVALLDNNGDGVEIKKLSWLQNKELENDEYLLITSANPKFHDEIRRSVRKYVDEKKIIDMFPRDYPAKEEWLENVAVRQGMNLENSIIELPNYKVRFYLPHWREDVIPETIIRTGSYYEECYLYYIKKAYGERIKNGIVLDIGANIGNHSLFFALECGAKKVFAFEPVKYIFGILSKNIEINLLDKVITPYNMGVGAQKGRANIAEEHYGNCGMTSLKTDNEGNIEMCAIDDFHIEDEVSLIKIDVEGFEVQVMKGALDTIKRFKPCIMVEAHQYDETIFDIIAMLKPLGYDYIRINKDNYVFVC